MNIAGLRSPYAEVNGLVYFGRMLDKARLNAAGKLPPGYYLGDGNWYFFDARCTRFLGVSYAAFLARALEGGTDEEVLEWCFQHGRRPSTEEIEVWSTFLRKRGWRDGSSEGLEEDKAAAGLAHRRDIVTWFDLFDAEEGRGGPPAP